MILDFHAHAYRRPAPFPIQFPTAEQVLERYDEAGIDKGVLLPVVSPEIYLPQANEDILEMVERYPDRFIPFCNLDPRALTHSVDAPLDIVLRYYQERGCKGVGEIMINVPTLDPQVQNLFRHCEALGLMVTWDGADRVGGDFGLQDDPGLPQMEHTLQRFPNLTVIAHGPLFWAEIGPLETPGGRKPAFLPGGGQTRWHPPSGPVTTEGVAPKFLRRFPTLYAELSDAYTALNRDHDYGPRFVTEFADRLLFGTDICSPRMVFRTMGLLQEWHASGKLTDDVMDRVMGQNAARLLGVEG